MDRIEFRKISRAEQDAGWHDGETLVALTAGACLLALIISLKDLLEVSPRVLTMDLLVSTCILGGLATTYPLVTRRRSASAVSHPGLWIAAIVAITMAIIVLHATLLADALL